MEMPTWEELDEQVDRYEELNPLEQFIYDNEPASRVDSDKFRNGLRTAIAWVEGNN